MNVLVVGKKNHIPWPYYTARGFEQNGYNTQLFYYNEYTVSDRIKKVFNDTISYDKFYTLLKQKQPKYIVFVSAFFIPKRYYEIAKELNIQTIGWVGDSFEEDKKEYKDLIDHLYLFDSALVDLSYNLGFNSELLQVGYDMQLHENKQFKRRDSTNFIGSYTQQREEILIKLESADLELYGLKWNKLHRRPQNWRISTNMVDYKKLIDIYNSTVSSINISQIQNVSNGVNMRIFETVACGSCLITDNLKDLELCFEPNKEVLVYNDTDELLELIQKVNNDKKFASSIVHNAQQRIQNSKYTYKDRTQYMIENTQR